MNLNDAILKQKYWDEVSRCRDQILKIYPALSDATEYIFGKILDKEMNTVQFPLFYDKIISGGVPYDFS